MSTNNNNNYYNQKNVTTKIKTFYSKLSCLQVTFWNKNISLKINPFMGVNNDGIRQYDFTKRISTAIPEDKCVALANEIEKTLIPALDKYNSSGEIDSVSVGVSVGEKGSKIFFEYKPSEDGIPSVYLTIYTGVDGSNKSTTENIYKYEFQKVAIEEDYNNETGESKVVYVESEFLYLYEKMKNINVISPGITHGITLSKSFSYVREGNNNQANYQNNYQNNSNNGNFHQPQPQQQFTNNMIPEPEDDGLPF